MLKDHPTVEDFEGFLRSAPGPGMASRNARVLRHLLAACSSCRAQLQSMGWNEHRLDRLFRFPVDREGQGMDAAPKPYDYSQAFAAAEVALNAFCAEGTPAENTPDELLAELVPLAQEEQTRRVTAQSRFANPRLVQKLMELSDSVRYESAARMLHLADLARLAAEACKEETVGSAPKLADLRSLGWRHYANALRVSGRLREAEDAFTTARKFCGEGTGDPHLRASLLGRLGSLRYFQRRFDEAIALADEVGRIYSELDEERLVATTMVQKAIAQIYAGDAAAAALTLNRAIPRIDQDADQHLLFAACHNLIRAYIDMGKPEQALSLYFDARELYRDLDPLLALRDDWQKGQILRDLGHLRAAEAALLQARQGFSEKELLYEVAVVSLDLSEVYLRLSEAQNLRETVAEMVPIFKALGVDLDMLAALLQLQKSDQQTQQASELIRFLRTRLEQLPHLQSPR